jgi:hypothetical protein
MNMHKGFRIALASAALATGLAVVAVPSAQAQVSFRGNVPLPHGRLSINLGDPLFPVGSYVPYGYRVYSRPSYGYGFQYRSRWIPVRQFSGRWIVCDPPNVYGDAYADGYDGYGDDGYYDNGPAYYDRGPAYYYGPSYRNRVIVERERPRYFRRDRDDRRSGGRSDGRRSDGRQGGDHAQGGNRRGGDRRH